MNIRPLDDRVVIRLMSAEEKTPGGIVLPKQAQELPSTGKVLSVGPGRLVNGERVKIDVKVGDKVVFSKYSGTDFDDIKIVREADILAVIE